MTFDKGFELLFSNEGGFQKDPRDSGNWTGGEVGKGELKGTKYGISAASFPNLDIEHLSLDQAKIIYKEGFWNYLHLDDIPEVIRFDLFDTAVNSGTKTAIKILQRALGTDVDGFIGPVTVAVSKTFDSQVLDKRFNAQRLLYLCSCRNWPIYGKTWVTRVANNMLKD